MLGPLERAEAVFARARGRRRAGIGPAEVRSPMDIDPTVAVPRSVIVACEPRRTDRWTAPRPEPRLQS